jgi:transposase
MECQLNHLEQVKLRALAKAGHTQRERERAQTMLYVAAGLSAKEISVVQRLDLDTVYKRRKDWQARGFASLQDRSRRGAPRKLNEAHRTQLKQWAEQEALTAPDLLTKLQAEFGVRVHRNTLIAALRQQGMVWKRTRHSLKKSAMLSNSNRLNEKSK